MVVKCVIDKNNIKTRKVFAAKLDDKIDKIFY